MSVAEVIAPLREWQQQGRRAAVATLVRVHGSAPRAPGARLALSDAGAVAGSISSGCVETDLLEHLAQVLAEGEPRLVEYGISEELAAGVGLSCGGRIEVLLSTWTPGEVWDELAQAVAGDVDIVLVTAVAGTAVPAALLLRPDGSRTGTLGSAAADAAAAAGAAPLFVRGGAMRLELEGGATGLAEALLGRPRLAVVGATPVAAALTHLAAWLGYAVALVEPRTALVQPGRFTAAQRVVHAWPAEALAELHADASWAVVVLGHEPRLDVPALEYALRAGCHYVGQIGGRRTQQLRRDALAERGLSAAELDRVHGPVGLDIGGATPEEVALSIMAELQASRHGRLPPRPAAAPA